MNDETTVVDESPAPEPADDLRGSLEAAFERAEAPGDRDAGEVSNPAPQGTEPEAGEADATRGPARDEQGRFARKAGPGDHGAAPAKAGAEAAGAKPATAPAAPPAVEPQAPAVQERPPQSWKPAAREHWGKLPAEVRQEVMRRDREVATALQESAHARKTAEAFHEAVRPFEAMLRAEGADPIRAVGALLQTAAALRTAPPGARASLVAQIIQTYGVPIDALAQALDGRPVQAHQQQAPYQDPRVDELYQRLEAMNRAQVAQVERSAATQIERFSADKEFFEDLRPYMADAIEIAAKRGESLTLDDAYARALAMRPDIQKIVAQREAAAAAATAKAATQRARAAASSVRSNAPVPAGASRGGDTLRDDLEAAFASSGR